MSQSPTAASAETAAYNAGWTAISRLIRRGFSWSGHERHCAFLNLGGWNSDGGRFAEVAAVSGLDFEDDGRSAALVDWDFDGDQDLIVSSRSTTLPQCSPSQSPMDRL